MVRPAEPLPERSENMELLIIRHGDPDYEKDSLTEKGWREAEYLSEKLKKMNIKDFYVSPLGRARDTASCTLKKLNREAVICPWLKEFDVPIQRPDVQNHKMISWDWLPQDWTQEPAFYNYDSWWKVPVFQSENMKSRYDYVTEHFDKVLAEHGYIRKGNFYRVEHANRDKLAFFCHFGLGCVLLSHLLHISPMILWHHFVAAPSSVTSLVTEERRRGTALFRMRSYGDVSHLYAHGDEPAFAARFCETYDSTEERHD